MAAYKTMYYLLFNAAADAIQALQRDDAGAAQRILKDATRAAEEIFLQTEPDIRIAEVVEHI